MKIKANLRLNITIVLNKLDDMIRHLELLKNSDDEKEQKALFWKLSNDIKDIRKWMKGNFGSFNDANERHKKIFHKVRWGSYIDLTKEERRDDFIYSIRNQFYNVRIQIENIYKNWKSNKKIKSMIYTIDAIETLKENIIKLNKF